MGHKLLEINKERQYLLILYIKLGIESFCHTKMVENPHFSENDLWYTIALLP